MVRCRLVGKQPRPASYLNVQGYVKASASRKRASKTSRLKKQLEAADTNNLEGLEEGKSEKKKFTKLRAATQACLVPRAARPFALFCKAVRKPASVASSMWAGLSTDEKAQFIKMSKEGFEVQHQKSAEAGIGLRARQRSTCSSSLLVASPQAAKKGPFPAFAAFLKEKGLNVKTGRVEWQQMPEEQRRDYFSQRVVGRASLAQAKQGPVDVCTMLAEQQGQDMPDHAADPG